MTDEQLWTVGMEVRVTEDLRFVVNCPVSWCSIEIYLDKKTIIDPAIAMTTVTQHANKIHEELNVVDVARISDDSLWRSQVFRVMCTGFGRLIGVPPTPALSALCCSDEDLRTGILAMAVNSAGDVVTDKQEIVERLADNVMKLRKFTGMTDGGVHLPGGDTTFCDNKNQLVGTPVLNEDEDEVTCVTCRLKKGWM